MPKAYLLQSVLAHKPAFVDISRHSNDASLAGVLPQGEVALVGQHRFLLGVLGYHQLIVVHLALQIFVIEILTCI